MSDRAALVAGLVVTLAALVWQPAAAGAAVTSSTKKPAPPSILRSPHPAPKSSAPARPVATTRTGQPPIGKNTDAKLERPSRGEPAAHVSVDARIATARTAYQAGRYAEVPTALVKLLAEAQCTPSQLASVYELLASAYVALGQPELAVRCFTELLTRRPAFSLDPIRTSPKIRAALDEARLHGASEHQRQGQATSQGDVLPSGTRRPM